jgi:hypothetical protein
MYLMYQRLCAYLLSILCCISLSAFPNDSKPSPIIPATGHLAVYQRALDAQCNLTVLTIAVEPGAEDLSLIAYFRLARGAKIVSTYITNGEGRESDYEFTYPSMVASQRRTEAAAIMESVETETVFLNFPHLPAASDSQYITSKWNVDTLQMRFMELISSHRPDIVIYFTGILVSPEIVDDTVIRELRYAVRFIGTPKRDEDFRGEIVLPRWDIERILVTSKVFDGVQFPVTITHPVIGKTYADIAGDLGRGYGSIRRSRQTDLIPTYIPLLTTTGNLESPKPVPASLSRIERIIQDLSRKLLSDPAQAGDSAAVILSRLAAVIDSVDAKLGSAQVFRGHERKLLLQWKGSLELLRTSILGVELYFSLSENLLTNRQLTYLSIDSMRGIENPESADLYFPSVDEGWFVNESPDKRFPIDLDEDYRLVTPQRVTYTFPHYLYGLDKPTVGRKLNFFLIYQGETTEKSFVLRNYSNFNYVPRFVAEVLTPVVAATARDPVIIQLTNHTRDGISDYVYVSGEVGNSERKRFNLPSKGSVYHDTLYINWASGLETGDHLLPLIVGQDTVGLFVARKFEVTADTSLRVGIVGARPGSPLLPSLIRVGVRSDYISTDRIQADVLREYDVIILDRKGLSYLDTGNITLQELKRFASTGGRLVVLAQDANEWNRNPLIDSIELVSDLSVDENMALAIDDTSTLLNYPNAVQANWWQSWIYRRAHNLIIPEDGHLFEIPLQDAKTGFPYIVSAREGDGTIIYCDLSLSDQLLNVHSGALSILANLISGRSTR